MARLTEAGKQKFKDLVRESTFAARRAAMEKKYQDLAEAVYASQGAERIALLKSLPAGVVPASIEVKVYFGGQGNILELAEALPHSHSAYSNRYRFGVDDPLTIRFEELSRESSTLEKEDRELRSQLTALLNSCTTDKQLLAAWPEAKDFLPQGGCENLPAPLAENLNRLIADLRQKEA
ncbi:MAG: hypothetical protein A2Y38_20030 [Spirochaetes bacterium GWB1_59_5]|nr:MAG: hypothetical protein A2Y38_20030 [Spirochaetes bacterium GWB1_59_5]